MRPQFLMLSVILFSGLSFSDANATIINVPADAATIQAAIDMAVDGDEVVLADGVYTGVGNKNLSVFGKAITVRSANGFNTCTINCEGSGRGFLFAYDETPATILEGISIIRGDVPFDFGGAVYIQDCSPTIRDCVFYRCTAGFDGGGVWVNGGSPSITNCEFNLNSADDFGGALFCLNTDAVITDCLFTYNVAGLRGGAMLLNQFTATVTRCDFENNSGFGGGAIRTFESSVDFLDCTFTDNTATGTGGGATSGAIYLSSTTSTIDGCTFTSNDSEYLGGAMYLDGDSSADLLGCTFDRNVAASSGGAIYSSECEMTMTDCRFEENFAGSSGGAVLVWNADFSATRCDFIRNEAMGFGGALDLSSGTSAGESVEYEFTDCAFVGQTSVGTGGSCRIEEVGTLAVTVQFQNCLFSGGEASNRGTAIYVNGDDLSLFVRNSSFSGNTSTFENMGAVNSVNAAFASIENAIFYGNVGGEILGNSSTFVNNSLVEGGWSGTGSGNLNADPLFVDADGADNIVGTEDDDLRIGAGSPCIDSGHNVYVPAGVTTDLDGNVRFADDPGTPDSGGGTAPIVDMGPYEYGSDPPAWIPSEDVPLASQTLHNYPNPFRPGTQIHFRIPSSGSVSLRVYGVDGRIVRELINGNRAAGPHVIGWDGTDEQGRSVSSGSYLYRLVTEGRSETSTMVLLR